MTHGKTLLVLLSMVVLSGCLGGGITQEDVSANATYEWNPDTTVRYNVTGDTFKAVTRVTNGTPVEAFRVTEFSGEQPISVSAVRFRYPNGSVETLNISAIEQTGSRTVITPPGEVGQLAYTADSFPKEFTVGIGRDGSYLVVLPQSMRIGIPVLGMIHPGGAELRVIDDRVHLRWASLEDGDIELQYYLERDFWLFAALVFLGVLLAIAGVIYYRVRIKRLVQRRKEAGLDLDQ